MKWTMDELAKLPPTLTIPEAGRGAWGWERARSYEESNKPDSLLPTITLSPHRKAVVTAELLRKLGVDPASLLANGNEVDA